MAIELAEHQKLAIEQLKNGSILCGGVGSGKSRTALAYYFIKDCKGKLKVNGEGGYSPMREPRDLYIITTARKRDTLEWEQECRPFLLSTDPNLSVCGVKVTVDSWNNIGKYCNVVGAFFIFDEQRVVGSGAWVKAFYQIAKKNRWILLSATPGDTWMDYIPVFIANEFYKNRTDFCRQHVIFDRWAKYPKVDRYMEVGKLIKLRNQILVNMAYTKPTTAHNKHIIVEYDKNLYDIVMIKRWNPWKEQPIKNISELCYLMRRVVNSSQERIDATRQLIYENPRLIIFYNFDYELEILQTLCRSMKVYFAEWNGHKHMPLPTKGNWVYLVQYSAGAEGWNCITTNSMLFYSKNYSYKVMAQAAGRIDRFNTPYSDLWYYHLGSTSPIDMAIQKCFNKKKDFNESRFFDV